MSTGPDMVRNEKGETRPTLPLVSLGKKSLRLLRAIQNPDSERFNLSAYANSAKVKRSTVYSLLDGLKIKGLVAPLDAGNWQATDKGRHYLAVVEGVGSSPLGVSGGDAADMSGLSSNSRREKVSGRGVGSLHYLGYRMPIDRATFKPGNIRQLSNKFRTIQLPNYVQYFVYLQGATLIINLHEVVLRIHDVVGLDFEDLEVSTLQRACEIFDTLNIIGLSGDSISLIGAHYARVNSLFAEVLQKHAGKMTVDLANGRKFWVDESTGPAEDETDSKDMRRKLDQFVKDVERSPSRFADVDTLKEVTSLLVQERLLCRRDSVVLPEGRPDYFG